MKAQSDFQNQSQSANAYKCFTEIASTSHRISYLACPHRSLPQVTGQQSSSKHSFDVPATILISFGFPMISSSAISILTSLICSHLLGLSVLCCTVAGCFGCPELLDFFLYLDIDTFLQLGAIAEFEQTLQKHEERSQDKCLEQVVQESWSSFLEHTMTNELRNP